MTCSIASPVRAVPYWSIRGKSRPHRSVVMGSITPALLLLNGLAGKLRLFGVSCVSGSIPAGLEKRKPSTDRGCLSVDGCRLGGGGPRHDNSTSAVRAKGRLLCYELTSSPEPPVLCGPHPVKPATRSMNFLRQYNLGQALRGAVQKCHLGYKVLFRKT